MSTERVSIEVREDGSRVVKRNLEEIANQAEATGLVVDSMQQRLDRLSKAKSLSPSAISEVNKMRDALRSVRAVADRGLLNTKNIAQSLSLVNELRTALAGVSRALSRSTATGAVRASQQNALAELKAGTGYVRDPIAESSQAKALVAARKLAEANNAQVRSLQEVAAAERMVEEARIRATAAKGRFIQRPDSPEKASAIAELATAQGLLTEAQNRSAEATKNFLALQARLDPTTRATAVRGEATAFGEYARAVQAAAEARRQMEAVSGPSTRNVLQGLEGPKAIQAIEQRLNAAALNNQLSQQAGRDTTAIQTEIIALNELRAALEKVNSLQVNKPAHPASAGMASEMLKMGQEAAQALAVAQQAAEETRKSTKQFGKEADEAIYSVQKAYLELLRTLQANPRSMKKMISHGIPQEYETADLLGNLDKSKGAVTPAQVNQVNQYKLALQDLLKSQERLAAMIESATPAQRQFVQNLLTQSMGAERAAQAMNNASVAANLLARTVTPVGAALNASAAAINSQATAVAHLGNTAKTSSQRLLVLHGAQGGFLSTVLSSVTPTQNMVHAAMGMGSAANGAVPAILRMGSAWYYVRRALYSLGGAFFLRELGEYADAWIKVTNRVAISTENMTMASAVMQKLYDVSQTTRADMNQIVKVYQRGAQASKQLHASQSDLIDMTQAVGMALAIQGVSAHEAYGALHQLGQALGSARVFSEEFNSINEAAPRILQAVANHVDEAGGSIARLKAMVVKGKLSNKEFFDALLKDLPNLTREFQLAIPTIGQAFTTLNNAMGKYVGETGQATGITTVFARGVMGLARHLDDVARVATVAGSVFAITFGWVTVIKLKAMVDTLRAAKTATDSLTIAMLRNPAFLIATAITALATALTVYRHELGLWKTQVPTANPANKENLEKLRNPEPTGVTAINISPKLPNYVEQKASLQDLRKEIVFTQKSVEDLTTVTVSFGDYMGALWGELKGPLINAIKGAWNLVQEAITRAFYGLLNAIVGIFVFIAKSGPVILSTLPGAIAEVVGKAINWAMKSVIDGLNTAIDAINNLADLLHAPDWFRVPHLNADQFLVDLSTVEGATDKFSEAMSQAYDEAFSPTYVQDALGWLTDHLGTWIGVAEEYYFGPKSTQNKPGFWDRVSSGAKANAVLRENEKRMRAEIDLNGFPAGVDQPVQGKDKIDPLRAKLRSLMDELDPIGAGFRKINTAALELNQALGKFVESGGTKNFLEGWGIREEDQKVIDNLQKKITALTAMGGKYADAAKAANGILVRQREAVEDVVNPWGAYLRDRNREIEVNERYVVGKKGGLAALKAEADLAKKTGVRIQDLTDVQRDEIATTEERVETSRKLAEQTEQMYWKLIGPIREYRIALTAVNKVLDEQGGKLSELQKRRLALDLTKMRVDSNIESSWVDRFTMKMVDAEVAVRSFAQNATDILSEFTRNFYDGMADAIAQSVVEWKSLKDTIYDVAKSGLQMLISSFLKLGLQMLWLRILHKETSTEFIIDELKKRLAVEAVGKTTQVEAVKTAATTTAAGTATTGAAVATATTAGAAITKSMAPAAVATAGATSGGSVIAATAALAGLIAMIALFSQFEKGGYTGNRNRKEIAGVVHGQEYVVNALGTSRNRDLLEKMNRGLTFTEFTAGNVAGGTGTPGSSGVPMALPVAVMPAGGGSPNVTMKVTIHNESRANIETEQIGPNEIRIIAREEARNTVKREAPGVIATEIRNPNSRVSTELRTSTTAGRRRS